MKRTLIIFFALVLLGAGWFFRDQILPHSTEALIITLNTEATDLSAYGLDTNNAMRTANIYQGLVAFDKDLGIIPALAVSWGNVSDTQWEFRLRQGVSYHDGSLFEAKDVATVFEKAKNSNNPNITPYLNSIESIEIVDPNRVRITTYEPDPLLLSKLTKLYLHKEESIGTGPYQLANWIQGDRVELSAFDGYWGEIPEIQKLIYEVKVNRNEREAGFNEGRIDILAAVSPEQAVNLTSSQLKKLYGLEINFLMFQLKDSVFSDLEIRKAVQTLIDPDEIRRIGNDFIRPANQFIASGVFGYNQESTTQSYDEAQEARNLFGVRLEPIEFDYAQSYRTLGEYLASQLKKAGFSVEKEVLDPPSLLEKIKDNQSELYLLGWQFESGDAGGFFDTFVHSQGALNQGRYENKTVDEWIEASRREMDPKKRLELLRKIGGQIQSDLIGIPLFETSRIYALQEDVQWEPRLDGLILGAEIKLP